MGRGEGAMKALRALGVQAVALAATLAIRFALQLHWPALGLAALQSGLALSLAILIKMPRWWWPMHLVFAPLVVGVSSLQLAPGWFLAGFALLCALYWNSARGQVPLYLSNAATATALAALLPRDARLVDVGCGTGSLVARVRRTRPDCRVLGLENAVLPWLIARLRGAPARFANFWRTRLEAEVVYAFLSPAPMARLWEKLCAELPAGALLVSNSFEVPGTAPERVVAVDDARGTRLFCYRIPARRG